MYVSNEPNNSGRIVDLLDLIEANKSLKMEHSIEIKVKVLFASFDLMLSTL